MTSNKDMPAHPMNEKDSIKWLQGGSGLSGLTKREHFAGLAMQGFLASNGNRSIRGSIPTIAVEYADALLAELDKVKT
jgi:hypothetical protein